MKTVTGRVISAEPISLSKAATILSIFASSSDNGASRDVSEYLRRASEAFTELKSFHRDIKSKETKPSSGARRERNVTGEVDGGRHRKSETVSENESIHCRGQDEKKKSKEKKEEDVVDETVKEKLEDEQRSEERAERKKEKKKKKKKKKEEDVVDEEVKEKLEDEQRSEERNERKKEKKKKKKQRKSDEDIGTEERKSKKKRKSDEGMGSEDTKSKKKKKLKEIDA